MKINKLFVAALATTTLFASCSKENTTGGKNEIDGIKDPTYVTFTFKDGTKAGTKAGVISDTDAGDVEADAKVIKDVRLLIFNANSKAIEVNEVVAIAAGKVTKLVTPGQKKMYVIANVESNPAMKGALDGLTVAASSTLDQFLALAYTATGTPGQRPSILYPSYAPSSDFTIKPLAHVVTSSGSEEGFPMSSTDALTYTFAANVQEAAALGGTASITGTSATNSFQIDLEFMLAKVGVKMNNTAAAPSGIVTGGTVADVKFAVRNIAQKTFITQQFAGGAVKSYYHSFTASPAADQAQYNPNFDYSADAATNVIVGTSITDAAGNYIYAAENTNQSLRVGQATYVAIKANFIPTNMKVAGEISWNPIASAGSRLILGAGVAGSANTTFVVLKKALGVVPAGTYFATITAVEKALALDASDGASEVYSGIPANDYDVYTNGVSWYRINIGNGTGAATVYGVERGNRYDVTINKITGPGFNHEDGLITGPENPLSEQTYISATIEAKGWSTVNQGSDI